MHVATELSAAQIQAYRLADNKTNEIAEWDKVLLPLELARLQALDFDMGLLGFSHYQDTIPGSGWQRAQTSRACRKSATRNFRLSRIPNRKLLL